MSKLPLYCVFIFLLLRISITDGKCSKWAHKIEHYTKKMKKYSCPSEMAITTPYGNVPEPTPAGIPQEMECGVTALRDMARITQSNGEEVQDASEFPWMGALIPKNSKSDTPICGTFIISDRYVLTAAHCVYDKAASSLYVTFGDVDLTMDGEDECYSFEVKTIIPHPDYKSGIPHQPHDIALLKLKKSIRFYDSVKPICIPQKPFDLRKQKITIAGWGGNNSSDNSPAVKLKKAELPIIEFANCQNFYKEVQLDDTKLCAGYLLPNGDGTDPCKGDSGGPLMWRNPEDMKFYAVGIISSGGCGSGVGLNTNIGSYITWIRTRL